MEETMDADALIEECLSWMGAGEGRVDCPVNHARGVLRHAVDRARGMAPPERAPVKFAFSERKAVEAVVHALKVTLADAPPTPLHLFHVLYLAERDHLVRFGRPIFCDTYKATPVGPVPTMVERILASDLSLCLDPGRVTAAIGSVRSDGIDRPAALRDADTDLLSQSDVEALAGAAARCAGKPLRKATLFQTDRAWRLTPPWAPIDWAAMLDPRDPLYESALERIAETAAFGSF